MRTLPAAALVALAAALSAMPAPSRAETVTCTPISAVPTTISSQGVYCLTKDVTYAGLNGHAINVTAGNVTIDCNGHVIDGRAGGAGTAAAGVHAYGPANITVRGCTLRGFGSAVLLTGDGMLLEDNRVLNSRGVGLDVHGDDYMIRRNHVRDTGGGTTYSGGIGIHATGSGEIRDNLLVDVHSTGTDTASAIYVTNARGANIAGNRIRDIGGEPTGGAVGIALLTVDNSSVRDNVIVGLGEGIGAGIQCIAANRIALAGNHVQGWKNALGGCTFNGAGNVAL